MSKNLSTIERLIRLALGALLLFVAAALADTTVSKAIFGLFGLYAVWEAAAATCPLHARLGGLSAGARLSAESRSLLALLVVQVTLAYEWWAAGMEKIANAEFVPNMANTLAYFASKNPFPWYRDFLTGIATQNASALGFAVEWTQVTVAIVLVLAAVCIVYVRDRKVRRAAFLASIVALVAGIVMNANFFLASGWTGPGTKGLNIVMFWVQAALAYAWIDRAHE